MIKYSRHKLSTIPVLSPTKSFAKSNQPEGMLLADALDCWDLLPHVDFLGCSSNFLGLYIRWPGHIYFKSSSWIVNCWVDTTYTTGGRIVFFHFQELWKTSWPPRHSDREKVSIWVPETWDHHHWTPVMYDILIYVSHLGSSSLPSWATRWTRSGTWW